MTKTSILVRSVLVVLAALVWSGTPSPAHAQDGGSASAAGPQQVFNPFASFSLNRFAFNTLGFLQVGDASPVGAASAGGGGVEEGVAEAVVVRPPYRPPVRSPYRPPPRPPF